jgi:hypothetical protein
MTYDNFINLDDEALDKPVYRIMPIHRVLQVLKTNTLTLVKPKKWDDPFENALLASAFITPDGERTTFAAKDSVYGQCWTWHRDTDAIWRIYSYQKDGVRLASTPRKLLNALMASDPQFGVVRCFAGQVIYQTKNNLLKSLGEINLLKSNGSGVAEALLYKRREFAHEREVRLIYSGPDGASASDIYSFHVEPETVFDRLTFDPRMDKELVGAYKLAIKVIGFKNPITQSTLYRPPPHLTFKLEA